MSASKPEEVGFCALSLSDRIAIADDGQEYPIIEMWDEFGQDTDEVDDAWFVVVEMAEDWFVGIGLDEFEDQPLN